MPGQVIGGAANERQQLANTSNIIAEGIDLGWRGQRD
jgi:hypothetical protein